ncbi:MAG: hypothetical protein GF388_10870 [Candidatus Aegiribacteria sp.]|nr:hypothetical protein [Candidatus Aegiribacteria sp.]MBD3295512.1 hypothetical protein [Candidatus Fermentibacteria bacterium]
MGIEIQVLKDYVKMIYSPEELDKEALREQRAMVVEALRKNELNRVLIDASELRDLPSAFTLLDHNSAVSKDEVLSRVKFAVLFSNLASSEHFLEDSAWNRGIRLKCFTDEDTALSWLLG